MRKHTSNLVVMALFSLSGAVCGVVWGWKGVGLAMIPTATVGLFLALEGPVNRVRWHQYEKFGR